MNGTGLYLAKRERDNFLLFGVYMYACIVCRLPVYIIVDSAVHFVLVYLPCCSYFC